MPISKHFIDPLPKYNRLFYNQEGWIGADGSYSVKLSDNITLWLYGDTLIGDIINDKRQTTGMINNSIALQHGKDPLTADVKFFWKTARDGKATSFIIPADNTGWFWPCDGVVVENKFYIFFAQIITKGEEKDKQPVSPFEFRVIGTWLAVVENPLDNPTAWRIKQHKIPWGRFSTNGNMFFGSALLKDKSSVYIYGYNENWAHGTNKRDMIAARVPADKIADFAQWRFFDNGKWQAGTTRISDLFNGIATEYSVSYQPLIKQYVAIYSENGVSRNITARFSPTPTGPWSKPCKLYEYPECDWHQNYFCYAAKGHPAISTKDNELIITYVCNSMKLRQLSQNARIYWPRFLSVNMKTAKAIVEKKDPKN